MYVESNPLLLQWFDYITFAGLIITYATVRLILYTCCTKQQFCFRQRRSGSLCEAKYGFSSQESSDKGDFFSFPLDTSIVTFLTCMLGATYEVRHNGIQLIYLVAAHGLAHIIVVEFLMPVLCDQRIYSVPEYLGLRFNGSTRRAAALLLSLHLLLQLGLVMCIPALTFSQVTGFPIWISLLVVGSLGLTYTGSADLRIGVLANAAELLILFVALITILVFGVEQAGGVHTFWQRIRESKLFNLTNFRFSPGQDYDLCSLLLGGLGIMLGFVTASPTQIEQFALATSRRNARIKGYVCMVFCWPFLLAMFALGLLAFTILNECDPWIAGLVTYRDQLLAFSTSMLFDKMVVIKGWLLACLMLGGFSSIGSNTNSLAAVILRDLFGIRVLYGYTMTTFHRTVDWVSRWVAILVGVVAMPIAFGLLNSPASLFKLSLATAGLLGGPLFAATICGMYMPFTNSVGTLLGLLISPFVGAGLLIYNVHFGATPRSELSLKSYVNCGNYSSHPLSMYHESERRSGFNLPYLYVGSACIVCSLTVTIGVSALTCCNRRSPADRAYMRLKYSWNEVASTHTLNSAETSDQFTIFLNETGLSMTRKHDISLTMGETEDIPTQSTYPRR
ncbi:hypothetical protein CRM22_009759 [Opisthorchis felineus]|uniref:Sodium-coupled monocarboxylate transporter 1 n=1 Tax=Opisthorchis felineus TaxID=147828 RepID=A0A4S2LCQ9_OPIFE|nr:hypothetical protein CRM22_009759 [Opisthorchis felineus]